MDTHRPRPRPPSPSPSARLDLLFHEARRCGPITLLLPLAATAGAAAAATLLPPEGFLSDWIIRAIVPVTVGLATATTVAADPTRELRLTTPVSWASSVAIRASLVTACGFLATILLVATGPWRSGGTVSVPEMCNLLTFSTFLAAVGTWGATTAASAGAACTLVVTAWLGTLLVLDRLLAGSSAQALAFAVAAGITALAAANRLGDGERLIARGGE